jgi:tRNA (adenine22-N1)-methyltransferase
MCPPGEVVIDVGADHGHVAHALGAIATERAPGRIGRSDVRWVVADGLLPFRRVDVAVIAGMGAATIAGILARGPRPTVAAVLHAQDDPPALRLWLAQHGFRIEAEGLAVEGTGFAEVIRTVPGTETATGHRLWFGPRLVEGDDPLLGAHLRTALDHHRGLMRITAGKAPDRHAELAARAAFLEATLAHRGLVA